MEPKPERFGNRVNKLADTVKVTHATERQKCRNCPSMFGSPIITNDVVTIAKEIELKTFSKIWSSVWLKKLRQRRQRVAGAGTTTANHS
jgi:chaperonin GroEL